MARGITLEDVKNNEKIRTLIEWANHVMACKGYTEHGLRHVGFVSKTAAAILKRLGYPDRTVELAAICGWVHDVGNCINRHNHGISGANLLAPILMEMGFPMEEVCMLISAVGNHEEQNGTIVSVISAAVVIADKVDAHRTRVRRKTQIKGIHERVNYAILHNRLIVDSESRIIRYEVEMDDSSSAMDFMNIYITRMKMCEESAHYLGCTFQLVMNGATLNNQHSLQEDAKVVAEDNRGKDEE